MKCLKSKKLLIEYADGRLRGQQREELESHLKSCRRCRDELKKLETSLQLVMETVDEDIPSPSADFIPELKRRIEKLDSKTDSKSFVWSLLCRSLRSNWVITQPKIWATAAVAFLLIISSILFLPLSDKNDRPKLSSAELQKIANHPEGQTLIEMLPASRPYIDAWLKTQEEKKAQGKIISTINNVDSQLREKVIKLLEFSADALENSKFKEEENLSCDDEIVI